MSRAVTDDIMMSPELKNVNMQTAYGMTLQARMPVVPASWGVGTFHQNNPIYRKQVHDEPGSHVSNSFQRPNMVLVMVQ